MADSSPSTLTHDAERPHPTVHGDVTYDGSDVISFGDDVPASKHAVVDNDDQIVIIYTDRSDDVIAKKYDVNGDGHASSTPSTTTLEPMGSTSRASSVASSHRSEVKVKTAAKSRTAPSCGAPCLGVLLLVVSLAHMAVNTVGLIIDPNNFVIYRLGYGYWAGALYLIAAAVCIHVGCSIRQGALLCAGRLAVAAALVGVFGGIATISFLAWVNHPPSQYEWLPWLSLACGVAGAAVCLVITCLVCCPHNTHEEEYSVELKGQRELHTPIQQNTDETPITLDPVTMATYTTPVVVSNGAGIHHVDAELDIKSDVSEASSEEIPEVVVLMARSDSQIRIHTPQPSTPGSIRNTEIQVCVEDPEVNNNFSLADDEDMDSQFEDKIYMERLSEKGVSIGSQSDDNQSEERVCMGSQSEERVCMGSQSEERVSRGSLSEERVSRGSQSEERVSGVEEGAPGGSGSRRGSGEDGVQQDSDDEYVNLDITGNVVAEPNIEISGSIKPSDEGHESDPEVDSDKKDDALERKDSFKLMDFIRDVFQSPQRPPMSSTDVTDEEHEHNDAETNITMETEENPESGSNKGDDAPENQHVEEEEEGNFFTRLFSPKRPSQGSLSVGEEGGKDDEVDSGSVSVQVSVK